MPELPEVEVTRRSFAERIAGARIVSSVLGKPLRWPLGLQPQALQGRLVQGVRRRGKYLLLDLNEGLLLIHLGMSGSLRFVGGDEEPLGPAGAHDHFDLQTTRGLLRLHDPRRFGAVIYVPSETDALARKLLDHLGMEPLGDGFTLPDFKAGLAASRAPIKQLLLSGSVVVGVGNIYASEVLFLSRIHPATPARDIGPRKVNFVRIHPRGAGSGRGAGWHHLRDFSSANGLEGTFSCRPRSMGVKACLVPIVEPHPVAQAGAAQHLLLRSLPEIVLIYQD